MTHTVESTSVWEKRLADNGMGDLLDRFLANGWDTMANFAYAAGFAPNTSDDTPFVQGIVVPLLGEPPFNLSTPEGARAQTLIPKLRKLYWESYSMMSAHMEMKITQPPDNLRPRPMPMEERVARMKEMKRMNL